MKKFPPARGCGRPKGRKNNRTLELGQRLERMVPDDQLIALMWKLAREGDSKCVTLLAERKWGKIPQPVTGADDGPPLRVSLLVSSVGVPIAD